jgi:hypothetical protein
MRTGCSTRAHSAAKALLDKVNALLDCLIREGCLSPDGVAACLAALSFPCGFASLGESAYAQTIPDVRGPSPRYTPAPDNRTVINTDHLCNLGGGDLGFAGSSTSDVAAGKLAAIIGHETQHYDDDYPWPASSNCAKKAWLEQEGEAYEMEAEILASILDCPDCITLDDAERFELEQRKKDAEDLARKNHNDSSEISCP